MFSSFKSDSKYRIFSIAIILAVILGLFTSLFFIFVDRDSYSSLYLVPDSIVHTHGNTTLFFEYGVVSSELGKMDYTLDTFINGENVNNKQFSLKPGEILEERQRILLPKDMEYPSKITLKLSGKGVSEEVHFWLK
jgi:hypothetical protein